MTSKLRAAALAAALLAAPNLAVSAEPSASANEWKAVATSVTGTVWHMRERDAQNQMIAAPRVWLKLDHSRDRSVVYRETKQFIEFECAARRTKTLETLRYNAEGGLVGQDTPSYPSFSYVPPDTVIEAVLMWACPSNSN
jgi:hypothetical protein